MEHYHTELVANVTASLLPALSPPPGVVPDFFHRTNRLWAFNVVAQTACMVVAGALFFLRCYVRLGFSRMPRQWILEDWMVCVSFTGLAIYSSLMSLMMNSHAGVHQWDLTQNQAHRVLFLFWIETIVYGPFIFFTKLSILLLYLRLLVPTRWSPLWTTIQIFIGISASFYTALTLVKIWQCDPQARAWNKSIPGRCINLPVLLEVSGLFNTISDALILLVPVKACWNLKMSWQKKVGVCTIFTIGAVAPIFSAIGFAYRVKTAPSNDTTYNNPLILLWGTAEVTTGVICACLPTLPSLVRRSGRDGTTTSLQPRSVCPHSTDCSKRSYSRNRDYGYNTYVELDDMQNDETKRKVVTTVEGGTSPARSSSNGSGSWGRKRVEKLEKEEGDDRKRNGVVGINNIGGRIIRTVRIEQTGGI